MATNAMNPNTDAAILSRLLDADAPTLSEEAARSILGLNFTPADRDRMNQLAEQAREGTLSQDDQDELQSYERVGHLLSLMKSKARRSLDATRHS